MQPDRFRALVIRQTETGQHAALERLSPADLPAGDLLVAVAYSSLNYKDGLAITGKGKVIRSFPMIPGIDLAGRVVESASPAYAPGDQVLLTGWGVGERTFGGCAQLARVRSEWVLPLPVGLTPRQAMGIGTAGLTAMLCVMALQERGIRPGGRPVAVTGAAGGVGSLAVALLAHLGYQVTAFTGRLSEREYLTSLGAHEVLERDLLLAPGRGPLDSERWAGAVDTVGGEPLAALLRATAYGGAVAACGMAAGGALPTSVFPFILRGVSLIGIDSVQCPVARREAAWRELAAALPHAMLEQIIQEIDLEQAVPMSEALLKGQVRGRLVVRMAP